MIVWKDNPYVAPNEHVNYAQHNSSIYTTLDQMNYLSVLWNTALLLALKAARQETDLCLWVHCKTAFAPICIIKRNVQSGSELWNNIKEKRELAVGVGDGALQLSQQNKQLLRSTACCRNNPGGVKRNRKQYIYIRNMNLFCTLTTMRSLKRKTSLWCAACFWALLTSVTSNSRLQHTSRLWGTERTCRDTQRHPGKRRASITHTRGDWEALK